ncbi:MAG: hypothetical protein ACREMQ_02755 [Longimicrobiales bacterium]
MSGQKLSRLTGLVAVGAHVWSGCATSATPSPADAGPSDYVIVDGKAVPATGNSLLEVLRGAVTPHRLALHADSPEEEPLVVLNGAVVSGAFRRLAEIAPRDVRRVATLRSAEAYQRYGPRAYRGAIIVETRDGRAR